MSEGPQDVASRTGVGLSREGACEGDDDRVTLSRADLSSLIESAVGKALAAHSPRPSMTDGGEYTRTGGVISRAPGRHIVNSAPIAYLRAPAG